MRSAPARILLEPVEEALARVARLAQLPVPLAPARVGVALGARAGDRPVARALVEQLEHNPVALEQRRDRLALGLGDAADDAEWRTSDSRRAGGLRFASLEA